MRASEDRRDRKDWARFDRADQLVTNVVLWLVVGLSAAYAVFIGLDWMLRRQVTLAGVRLDVPDSAAGTGRVVGDPEGNVLVESVSGGHFALLMVPVLLSVAATVCGAVALSRFLADLGRGEPFSRANVTRLRFVAVLLVLVPVLAAMLEGLARSMILAEGGVEQFAVEFSPGWLVAGLLVASVAQAFANGTKLRADVDGLV